LQHYHLAVVVIAAETEIVWYLCLYIPHYFYPQMKSQAIKFYWGTVDPSEEVVGEGGGGVEGGVG
jgi:hypothetical protein